jgi:hypothetical protein
MTESSLSALAVNVLKDEGFYFDEAEAIVRLDDVLHNRPDVAKLAEYLVQNAEGDFMSMSRKDRASLMEAHTTVLRIAIGKPIEGANLQTIKLLKEVRRGPIRSFLYRLGRRTGIHRKPG